MTTSSTLPTRPASMPSRTARKLASKRRLKPIWKGTPARLTAARQASTRSRVRWIGFSQKIALPAAAAAIARSAWVSVAEAMTIPATPRSAKAVSRSTMAAPVAAAILLAASCRVSTTYFSRARLSAAMLRAWIEPICPAPKSANSISDKPRLRRRRAEIVVADPGIGQRMRLRRVLLGLDDQPTLVARLFQHGKKRRIVDRAVARHGEDPLHHGIEKAAVGVAHAFEHRTADILAVDVVDARDVAPHHGKRVTAGIGEMAGIEQQPDRRSGERH